MNLPTPIQAPVAQSMNNMQSMQEDDDSINLLDLLDVLLDHRWLISIISVVIMAIGGTYAYMATPIYEANALIQVKTARAVVPLAFWATLAICSTSSPRPLQRWKFCARAWWWAKRLKISNSTWWCAPNICL
jgi:hypothetical protein